MSAIEMTMRTNQDRSEATRTALLAAARELFVRGGYAETSTPAIVERAEVTRGALYHHFADKRALFRAVVEEEARAVALKIEAATPPTASAREALRLGSDAFLDAMTKEGRARLLLIEGPAVLGLEEMRAIDARHGGRTLEEGLEALAGCGATAASIRALADLLSAAFDRAALAVVAGESPTDYRAAMLALIDHVADALED